MKDMYDSFYLFLRLNRNTGLFMKRTAGASILSSALTAEELSRASANWCGHLLIKVPFISLKD